MKDKFSPFLKGIARANIVYCAATAMLVIYFNEPLTWLDVAYFTGEITVILSLVTMEYQKSSELC